MCVLFGLKFTKKMKIAIIARKEKTKYRFVLLIIQKVLNIFIFMPNRIKINIIIKNIIIIMVNQAQTHQKLSQVSIYS